MLLTYKLIINRGAYQTGLLTRGALLTTYKQKNFSVLNYGARRTNISESLVNSLIKSCESSTPNPESVHSLLGQISSTGNKQLVTRLLETPKILNIFQTEPRALLAAALACDWELLKTLLDFLDPELKPSKYANCIYREVLALAFKDELPHKDLNPIFNNALIFNAASDPDQLQVLNTIVKINFENNSCYSIFFLMLLSATQMNCQQTQFDKIHAVMCNAARHKNWGALELILSTKYGNEIAANNNKVLFISLELENMGIVLKLLANKHVRKALLENPTQWCSAVNKMSKLGWVDAIDLIPSQSLNINKYKPS